MDTIQPQSTVEVINNTEVKGAIAHNDYSPLQGYFNIQNATTQEKDQLAFIYDYYSANGIQTQTEMLINLGDIAHRLGMSVLGESKMNQIYQYLRVQDQIKLLEQQKSKMER